MFHCERSEGRFDPRRFDPRNDYLLKSFTIGSSPFLGCFFP